MHLFIYIFSQKETETPAVYHNVAEEQAKGKAIILHLSRAIAFHTILHMRPAKTQINLRNHISPKTLWIIGYPQCALQRL